MCICIYIYTYVGAYLYIYICTHMYHVYLYRNIIYSHDTRHLGEVCRVSASLRRQTSQEASGSMELNQR